MKYSFDSKTRVLIILLSMFIGAVFGYIYEVIFYKIDTGYHSYSTIEKAQEDLLFGNELIIKCIIPKNTEYYINTNNEIVSSTIIVTDQIVY